MMFSKSCEYAIKAVLHLCINTRDGKKLSIHEIAETIESPEPFTAKILQTLVKHKIISSSKGPGGGFFIDKKTKPIVVMDIVEVMDGKQAFERCGLGLKNCDATHPCPIHDQFVNYSQRLKNLLEKKPYRSFRSVLLPEKLLYLIIKTIYSFRNKTTYTKAKRFKQNSTTLPAAQLILTTVSALY